MMEEEAKRPVMKKAKAIASDSESESGEDLDSDDLEDEMLDVK
jgi:hypothetical protein